MSRGEGVEVPFLVYVRSSMSQVVEVKALTIEQAIERGPGVADVPNISNSFEPEGDPEAWAVMDSGGNQLWCVEDEDEDDAEKLRAAIESIRALAETYKSNAAALPEPHGPVTHAFECAARDILDVIERAGVGQ